MSGPQKTRRWTNVPVSGPSGDVDAALDRTYASRSPTRDFRGVSLVDTFRSNVPEPAVRSNDHEGESIGPSSFPILPPAHPRLASDLALRTPPATAAAGGEWTLQNVNHEITSTISHIERFVFPSRGTSGFTSSAQSSPRASIAPSASRPASKTTTPRVDAAQNVVNNDTDLVAPPAPEKRNSRQIVAVDKLHRSERQSVYQRSYRDRIVEDNKLTAEAGTESLHSVALEASQHLASAFGQQSRLHFDTPSPLKPNTHAAAHLMAGTQEDEEDQPSQAHDHAPPGALRGKLKPSPPPPSPPLPPTPLQSAPASRLVETWGRGVLSAASGHDKMLTHGIAGVSGEVVSGFDAKISSCVTLCNALRSQLDTDVLAVETATCADADFNTRSTVGIMLNGHIIENMVVGGPAYNTGQLQRGDEILLVDGVESQTLQELQSLLRGSDVPGSIVVVTVRRGERLTEFKVSMKRMATEEIADKRRMLELFTRLENFVESHVPLLAAAEGAGGENPEEELVTTKEAALRTVDAAIQLWSKMLLADAQHDQTIADNITDVQAKGKALLAGLLQQLEQLPALFAHAQRPVVEHCAMTLARARAEHEDERMRRQSNGMLHMACRQQLVELRIVFLQWASHSRRRRWARVKDSWVSDRQRHETLASGWAAWQREVLVAQRVAKENALQRLAAVEVERDGLKTALAAEEARLVARETERDSAAISEYERLRVNLRSKETVRRTQLCSRVIKRLLHHHLAVSYRGFAEGVLAARRERETVFRVMLRTSRPAVATKGGLSWALRLWRESTEKVVRLKTACVKVVMRMTCTLMFAGFERWREHTVERQRLQDTARRVIGRWAFASSARGFQLWRDKTTLIRRQRGVIIRVSARLMNRIQAVALSTWRSNTQHQQNLRVTARRIGLRMRHSIVSTALRTWSAATVRTRRHNILVAKALWRLVSARVARAYASWRENTLRIVNTRRVVARAIQRMLDSTVLRSIERWREAVARQVYVRKVMRGMLARSRPRLMEAAFCSWAEFVDGQCNFVDKSLLALENEAEVCLRTFFTDWCHGIFMTRHSRESRVWILGLHVQTSRLRRCVRAWKQHTLAAIWLRARHRELRLSHLRALKARVWRVWHQWLSAERLDSSLNCSGELSVVFARLSRREEIASLRAKEHAKKLLLSDKAAKLAAATSKKASFGLWKHAALRARHQAAGVLRILQRQHLLRVGWTSLVAWMRFTAQSRHRRRGEANLLMRAERRLSAALVAVTWDAWREACGEARRLERIKRVIITRLCLLSAGAAFGTWQHRAAQHRQMRHLMQSVLARMRSAAAAKALLTWRTNAVELRRQAAVGLKVLKRWQHRTATMMFLAWHHLWRHASDLRRVSCRAVARCRRLVVAKAYHTWMRVVQDVVKGRAEEEQKQATMRRVGMSLLRRAERVAFNTWLQHAGLLRHQRGVLQKMTLRIQNITAFKAFCSWHDSVNLMNRCAAITSKVLQRWTNRITAKMFTCWEQRWLDSKRLHYIASKVVRRWMLIELSLAWSVWMENSLEQAKQRSTGKKVVMRWTNRALSKVWSCWKDLAAQRQQQRTLLKKMLHRMTNILLHQSFLTWEGYLTDRQREQCDLDEMRKGREVEELREAAVRHLAERENAEREAKVLTTTLLRDLTRQQQGMKEAQAKAKALDEEVLRLRSQLDGCRCMQGKVTPREREIGESLKMEMFHRCHSTVGLVLRGLEVMEIVPGSPAEQSGQIKAGDMVVSVDGRPVDESTVAALIIGSDLAGTLVDLELRKPRTGVVVHVPLTRASHAIQFSSRHGDHDLKIVVDTVCDPVLRPNSLRREPLQHALDANPPSRSRSRTPTSSADIAPTVNHEPEFVRDGVWRVRVENPSQHVDEADEALTLPAAGDAVSVDSLSSCVSVGREAGGTLSRMASDSRGVADSSDDGWHFNQEEWRILAALEAEAAAPPPPLPSLVVTNSRVTPPATSRSRHNAVLSALGFETSSQAHMSDIVAPSKAAPAPPRMTTHEQAQFASLRFQPGQHTATSVLPIVGPIPPPPASCRMCSTPVLVHDAAGHGRGGVPAVWREGNTPRAGQGCQDVDARPASGLGVCMFDSDGMPYYSCQECVDICASTSWRTARSAPGFSASSRSISPNNPAVI